MTKEELEEVCKEIRDLNEERSIREGQLSQKVLPIPLERIALALERIAIRLDSWDSASDESSSYLSVKDYSDF